jgi:hypothetical protein
MVLKVSRDGEDFEETQDHKDRWDLKEILDSMDSRVLWDQLVKTDHVAELDRKDLSVKSVHKDQADLKEALDLRDDPVKMESLDLKDHQDLQDLQDHQPQPSSLQFPPTSKHQCSVMVTDTIRAKKETRLMWRRKTPKVPSTPNSSMSLLS